MWARVIWRKELATGHYWYAKPMMENTNKSLIADIIDSNHVIITPRPVLYHSVIHTCNFLTPFVVRARLYWLSDHGSHLLNWSSLARTGQAILLETDLRLLLISDIRPKKLSVVSSLGYAEGWKFRRWYYRPVWQNKNWVISVCSSVINSVMIPFAITPNRLCRMIPYQIIKVR